MEVSIIGIDLAKNIMHIHGVDNNGKTVFKKKLQRDKLLEFMANQPKCLVGMEACGGSNHWAREITKLGHDVRLMAPQFVKPYVKTNKNDRNDAEAICEAVSRPNMRFVPIKTTDQQSILSIYRVRERLVKSRTALSNEIRGLLSESGITIPQGVNKVIPKLIEILDSDQLSEMDKITFTELLEELKEIFKRVEQLEVRLKTIGKNYESYYHLLEIPGIGLVTATALIAAIGNAANFENGRQLSAWLGLVPKQHSTGGKERLLGISKRGDIYLRNLLIHGARAVFNTRMNKEKIPHTEEQEIKRSKFTIWINGLSERRGYNTSVVAVANKLARVVYAVLKDDNKYEEIKVCS